MEKNKVELWIYDLSMGMAKNLAHMLIGKPLEGIWHTSIVVYGREYMFNSNGVENCIPGSHQLKTPERVEVLGYTEVPLSVFAEYISTLSESSYAGSTYDLFKHNCNTFSEEIAQFLVGKSIPQYILDLPNEVLSSKLSPQILDLLTKFERSAHVVTNREGSPGYEQLNIEIEEARYNSFLLEQRRKRLRDKLLKKERKREKKRKKDLMEGSSISVEEENATMAEAGVISGNSTDGQPALKQILALEEEEKREQEKRKKSRDPPIVFVGEIDEQAEFDVLVGAIEQVIDKEEEDYMEQLSQYLLDEEGCWALSDGFLLFIAKILYEPAYTSEVRISLMKIMAFAALKDDFILLLHQDREHHVFMNYLTQIDSLPLDQARAASLFLANLFENLSSSEWLLYISEWTFMGKTLSNIRVTTKVGVHCLLADDAVLQDRGSAIIYNMACKEVKTVVYDDVAVELTMAVLQFLKVKPNEEFLFRSIKALSKFMEISRQEVPQLIQMIGPDPRDFMGTSRRIDKLINEMGQRLL
ncbi:hypothetical protein HHI36_015122 [Cryptolaemus montrouzieri]|uniref:PPPDE domain-containing protein n=1 Tax=Cryptolaemus montrouzieri TaxID=559131 RepID=A0ABD2N510_9CUCU